MITFKNIIQLLLQYKRLLIGANIIALVATIISIPIPLLIPLLVDEVLLKKEGWIVHSLQWISPWREPIYYIVSILFVTITLRFIFFILNIIAQKYFILLAQEVSFSLRKKALEHLKKVSMSSYEALGSGKVITHLITDIDTIEQFVSNALSKWFVSIATLVGVAVVLIWINPLFGILILIFQPLIMIITRKISGKVGILKKEQNKQIGLFSDNLTQMCDLFGQIRASNKETYFIDMAVKQSILLKETAREYGNKSVWGERYSYTLFLSGFEIFRAFGLVMVLYSDLSIGLMFGIFGYLWFMMTPVQDLLSLQYSFANAKNALSRLNELFELPLEPQYNVTKALPSDGLGLSIQTNNLSFGYNENDYVLKGINLNIVANTRVAIIGASGSGKSTLSQLLVGFYPPSSGEIFYNGISVKEIGFANIRKKVFVVLQQPLLFNDSLRFNLTMGELVDEAVIWNALKIAQLDEFIKELPNGLETQIGKFGIRLSGGQRQRLSIARMVLANPSVVIFDESTSALDVHTESALFEALDRFLENKTVIIIAHRLSTVGRADYIYVLENGTIIEEGRKEVLEALQGNYQKFVNFQTNA